jgi:acyl-CoA reductase-like NAD-dependent aldehyde dehydrogenase
VVALVTPFPLPFALPLVQVGAALAMGNAVVLKPSELAPCCGLKIAELCEEAGFPAGLVGVVTAGREQTLHLVAHPRVDKVFFAGSTETGRQVMATAGCAPRPVVLSLSGKHPSIVAADADVQRAARGVVWGALANAGQNCGAIERVYVDEHVAARFVEAVLAESERVRMGDPLEEGTDLGPLVSDDRLEAVHRQVTEAVQAGARLLLGGTLVPGPGFFYPPTVLLEPPPGCRILREETLGPVIPIVVVDSLERAIVLANDSDYALTASGWTTSSDTAARMMSGLQAGVVTINDVLYSFGDPASTWSGHRASGVGNTHGFAGLQEMSRRRFVSYVSSSAEAPVFAFPYDAEAARIAQASLQAIHGGSLARRLSGLAGLLRGRRFRARRRIASFLLSILPHRG